MARTIRSTQLDTRAARLRLDPRRKPYRASSAKKGLHLGYRRIKKRNGTWIAISYRGSSGQYAERVFGQADDYSEADGSEVLTYYDAMQRVSGEAPLVRHGVTYSVRDMVVDYVAWLKRERKTAPDAKSRLEAYVVPYFGDRPLAVLRPADFDKWLEWAMAHKPRGRLKDGRQSAAAARARVKGKVVPPVAPPIAANERARRRRATLNRVINYLKAALNRAADQGQIASRDAWARLQKFRSADSARIARLTTEEARRLTNACPPDFRRLVELALLTGCRYGELTALRVRDFDLGSATVLVAESKAGRPRRVPLTDEGKSLLEALTVGKGPDDLVLTKGDGCPWGKSEQFRRMRVACAGARIMPAVNFHAIRHTFASLLVEAGTPLAFVAEALGHADTRMVSRHYAHISPNVLHHAIRANLPSFGITVDTNVQTLKL